jgi:hypothetical protein
MLPGDEPRKGLVEAEHVWFLRKNFGTKECSISLFRNATIRT